MVAKTSRQRTLEKYGLTESDYESMLILQDGVCWVCKQPPKVDKKTGKMKNFHVDHNHSTGEVRGLLCYLCNHVHIGRIERRKNPLEIAQNIVKYLKKFSFKRP